MKGSSPRAALSEPPQECLGCFGTGAERLSRGIRFILSQGISSFPGCFQALQSCPCLAALLCTCLVFLPFIEFSATLIPDLHTSNHPHHLPLNTILGDLQSCFPRLRNKPATTCNGTPVFAASHGRKRSEFCCQELQRAAEPPSRAGLYLDFPAGRMDTGSVCTSASDVLLEPCGTGEAPLETSLSVSGWSGQDWTLDFCYQIFPTHFNISHWCNLPASLPLPLI